jgi:exopolysaccharide biosynthesis polyprenyl glycosylphosphotransferase
LDLTVDTYDATTSMAAAAMRVPFGGRAEMPQPPKIISMRFEVLLLVVVDALVASLAGFVGLDTRFHAATASVRGVPYGILAFAFPVVWIAAMALGGAYDRRVLATGGIEYRRVVNAAVWLGATTAVASYMFALDLSRGFVAITVPLAIALTLFCRVIVRKGLHRSLAQGAAIHRVVVVGPESAAERLVRHLTRSNLAGYAVVGTTDLAFGGRGDDPETQKCQVEASLTRLVDKARRMGADTIAVAGGGASNSSGLQRLSWHLEGTGIQLMVAPNVADVAGPRILVRPIAGLPLLHIEEPEFRGAKRVVKACIDRVGAGLLLIVASPVLAAIALAALVTHGRPILYCQDRVGRDGRDFTIHKFRTMRPGADREAAQVAHLNVHDDGPLFKIPDDPRVTRLGRVLRRYSLDELPQLWDVLTGSMSLVGPRPPLVSEVRCYGNDARRRLLVKPGITGLWQVSGRSDLSWDESVRLDLHYVENWSVGLDLSLLWRTLAAVVTSKGAY